MKKRGFTLVEIVVVMLILGVVLAMAVRLVTSLTPRQFASTTSTRLAALDVALANFVSMAQRLPCPADGGLPVSDANAGLEQRQLLTGDCLNNQALGVVPWRTLGVSPSEATDGYGTLFTYRVSPELARDAAMNMTACDAAGMAGIDPLGQPAPNQRCRPGCQNGAPPNTPAATCTGVADIVAARGLTLKDAVVPTPNIVATGAAYVLLSHGENRAGGYAPSGYPQASSGLDVGPGEVKNDASVALAPYYVDAPLDTSKANHFDDVVSHPQIMAVASNAKLSPRVHN